VWLLGKDLFVQPVMEPGVTSVRAAVPAGARWFHVDTRAQVDPGAAVAASLSSSVPVFQRSGSIIPRQMRLRRSSDLMRRDPYTLDVALASDTQAAVGELYLDDQTSFAYMQGAFVRVRFSAETQGGALSRLTGKVVEGALGVDNVVERVVVVGGSAACVPRSATATQDAKSWPVDVECAKDGSLVVRRPWVNVGRDFEIRF
jgi:alpha 1,3-glucosidase